MKKTKFIIKTWDAQKDEYSTSYECEVETEKVIYSNALIGHNGNIKYDEEKGRYGNGEIKFFLTENLFTRNDDGNFEVYTDEIRFDGDLIMLRNLDEGAIGFICLK